ncbi:aldolase catalytic domain-containing protein [Devosia sp.]|uniref:aldolase catalytic domain-containing protein n=1 Tax=Devosia sp. TaxID=1871048 RepID=UPI003A8D71F4
MYLLDCTLRDGGYYNNWDFPVDVVNAYLEAVALAKIELIELGLRNFPKSGFLGAYAYTTEEHLNSLVLPSGPSYGVMIDAKTILSSGLDIKSAVNKLFVHCCESKLDFVRVAAHFHEVEECEEILSELKSLDYKVGLNLMQSAGKSEQLIQEKAKLAHSWRRNIDVLYFADSLGNMDSNEVMRVLDAIKSEWSGEIGIHTHDNMSKGLENSVLAYDNGVKWLDSTITGMGRGAGNTQTERLLPVINDKENKYNVSPIYDVVIRHFEKMQKKYCWGTSLLYFLGARNNVHPTYIQNLLSNSHYGTEEIIGAIEYLSQLESTTSFNGDVLKNALAFNKVVKPVSGSSEIKSIFLNEEVLILTNAPSVEKYKEPIKQYIINKKPKVLSININNIIDPDLIDYYIVSHNAKFFSDSSAYNNLNKPLILPSHRFTESEIESIKNLKLVDFGFDTPSEEIQVFEEYVRSPVDLTIVYALGLSLIAQAKKVSLVGFDGYNQGDQRQLEVVEVMHSFVDLGLAMEALTPTTYPVKQGSIYAI